MPIEPQPCGAGGSGDAGPDVEQTLLCDVLPDGTIVGSALAVYEYDETGAPIGAPTFVDPATGLPYVAQGVLQPCGNVTRTVEILCDVNDADGSAVQFERVKTIGPAGTVLSIADFGLDGAPYTPLNDVQVCDPYSNCTPDANQDLNAQCGPGETVTRQILLDDLFKPLANSVFNDDATADPLCGGTWDRPADALPPGFPVAETFRNTTFDQPGPVTQGQPNPPFLTAGPPTNDGAGAGWIRLSDGSYASNGIWQVPAPFSTSQGMNAAVTLASHDGTTPGGDGQYFVFTDGAAGTQATPIGGFGNLGLNNWTGGVFAVVLDEYGQSCTCGQALPSDPNPGPCGFCGNTISIQRAGASRVGATCSCCTIASAPLAPKAINQTTRAKPLRLLTSVISEGGQTYVSASVDWNDGNGPIQYFDRVNITACITVPPTLRMGLSMNSGGAYQAVKEARDAVARPAGVSNWRAFPITTDVIPACVSLVNINASVDVTPNDDGSQTAGNGEPEAYFWLVNTATNTVLGRDQYSIIPTQLGQVKTLTVSASVPPADVPNLRLYVGAESRDDNGEYDTTWENLTVDATGTGCPATPRRTMEISARCPIPVTIVGGGTGEGGGGGTTIVNTPSTFEDQIICGTVGGVPQTAFRREVRSPDGGVEVTFLGFNGLPITPDGGWTPGPCECVPLVLGQVCVATPDAPGATVPASAVQACDGTVAYINASTGDPWTNAVLVICPPDNQAWEEILCDQGNDGHQFRRVYNLTPLGSVISYDEELDTTLYVPVGPVGVCPTGSALVVGEVCYSVPLGETAPFRATFAGNVEAPDNTFTLTDFAGSGVDVTIVSAGPAAGGATIQLNPPGNGAVTINFSQPVNLKAIQAGELDNTNQERWFGFTPPFTGVTGALVPNSPFAGAVSSSIPNGNPDGDIQFNATVSSLQFTAQSIPGGLGSWLQELEFTLDIPGGFRRAAVVKCDGCTDDTVQYFDLETGDEVLTPTIVDCPAQQVTVTNPTETADTEVLQLCDDGTNPPARFLRRLTFDGTGALTATVDTDYAGAPYIPVGNAIACGDGGSTVVQEMCDRINISTTQQFFRQMTFNGDGILTSLALLDPDGLPYVTVGEVRIGHCDPNQTEHEILCDQPSGVRFLRVWRYSGFDADSTGFNDYTLDGITGYAVVGTAQVCPGGASRDEELLILCDATPTRFLRRYNYDSTTGALVSIVNTTLDGSTAFAPVGAVGVCTTAIASDFDFLSTVLCDANGAQFIQRLTFNSSTGAVTATTNTTLTGAAFVPVAPVALCSSCCPVVMGEGCTNVGSLRYTALRLTTGAISLIDSVTGAAVLAANIVTCAPANGVLPGVAADHFEVVPGTPWTTAAIPAGRRLVSLTYTVLTGTATVVDATGGTPIATIPAGYSATWTAQDDRETLTPPASITSVGGRVIVLMLTAA